MYGQRDIRWKNEPLGFGVGTIGNYGCYLVSLCNGLNRNGYSFTPKTLNNLFKQNNLFINKFKNYIDVARITDVLPGIFESYQRVNNWADDPQLDDILKENTIALGRVSGAPIGGTTHFVLTIGRDRNVAIIHDPWSNVEEKISERWANHGYINGLRLFKVKPYQDKTPEESPLTDFERAVEAFKEYRVVKQIHPSVKHETFMREVIQAHIDLPTIKSNLETCQIDFKELKNKKTTTTTIDRVFVNPIAKRFNQIAVYFEETYGTRKV